MARIGRHLLVLTVLALAWASSAAGQDATSLAGVRVMVDDARYDEAIPAARALIEQGGLSARDHGACLELLAISLLANRNESEADATLGELYRRDPEHRLSDTGASPVVQAAFARAHDRRGPPLDVTIESRTPAVLARGARAEISLRITAGADAVEELRIAYRARGSTEVTRVVTAVARDGSARSAIPLGEDRSVAQDVEFWVEAIAPSQARLGGLGSESEPSLVTVPPRVDVLALGGGQTGGGATGGSGSIFGKWWFWTVIGAVVVAGSVTAVVVASSGGPSDGSLGSTVLMLR